MPQEKIYIGIIGAGKCNEKSYKKAVELGKEIACNDGIVICGGKSGIMEAVCKGTKENDGISIGILPEENRNRANNYLNFSLTTGMGQARNLIIVTSSNVVIAVSGAYGTLSEIALAQKHKTPTILLDSWPLLNIDYNFDRSLLFKADNPKNAVELAMNLAEKNSEQKSRN